jgi:hypothetical protein
MRGNYWPHAIVLMILGSIVASFFTIKVAIQNPVQDSSLFLQNYHITDKHINEILREQIEFDSKYSLDYSQTVVESDGVEFQIELKNRDEKVIDAQYQILVTRPEVDEFDKSFNTPKFSFQFPKSGRWLILTRITVDEVVGYHNFEIENGEIKMVNPFISHKRVEKIEKMNEERVKRLLEEY